MKTALLLVAALALGPTLAMRAQDDPDPKPKTFEVFAMKALREARAKAERAYLPFLNRSSLRCGLYHLKAQGSDGQSPHDQDEVYYVLNGKAKFTAGEETVAVTPGQVLFVAAQVEHRFHDIEQDIDLLVFFSSAKPMTADEDER